MTGGRVSALLKSKRIDDGLSREALAEEIGVNPETIRKVEGELVSRPAPRNQKRIAEYLGFRATELWPIEEVAA